MKHLFSLSLLLLALLLPATALAHDFEVDGIYYNINGSEATVTYKGSSYYEYSNEYSGSVAIPATVTYNGTAYSVTKIGDEAFRECSSLTSIDIPNSVTSIGDFTFAYCSGLISIEIPKSVTTFDRIPFTGCSSLTRITVASGNTTYDSRDNCNAIIETASNTLFLGCKNTVIPNSVTSIGNYAFSGCSGMTSIDIPNSVTSISDWAFASCSGLISIDIPNSVTSIGGCAFYGCSGMTSVTIPNSVTSIADWAFFYCSSLTSIDIPSSVTSIGVWTFAYCSGLTRVTIPNSVTSIADWAFRECSSLTSIDIPNSVTSIGEGVIYGCSDLTEIYCWALTPPTLGGSFSGCYGATLYVPYNALDNYKATDYWKDFANIDCITIEVDSKYYRVLDANKLSVIASNDEAILYSGDVVIPDSVTYEGYTFAVTGIENNAFDGCFELTSVVIPNSVETIGEQAFQGCTGLMSVTIGSGVTAIGSKAFNYCNALATVKCIGTLPPVMASADCFSTAAYNRATLLVPRNTEATYTAADYWYKFAHIDGWGSAGRGDIDGDGVVSIRDVTTLIDAILNGNNEGIYFESADVNINGRLDIGDVTTIVDMLLNDIE